MIAERWKFYPVIKAVKAESSLDLTQCEYLYGPILLRRRSSILKEFLLKEQVRIQRIIENLVNTDRAESKNKLGAIKKEEDLLIKAMNNYKKLILASGSPRRRELLCQMGADIEIILSNVDEQTDITEPAEMVCELSRRKCSFVASEIENGIVLGADTVVSIEGKILGKPRDEVDAKKMLRLLSGKAHQVYTGVTLIKREDGKTVESCVFSEKTDVFVAELTAEEIEAYVKTGEPLDKAGAYAIQGLFAKHITGINGDYFNVVGLPVSAVYSRLRQMQQR